MELISCFYTFVCALQHPDEVPAEMKQASVFVNESLQFLHQSYKDGSNPMEHTWSNCVSGCLQSILAFTTDSDIYPSYLSVPMILMLT